MIDVLVRGGRVVCDGVIQTLDIGILNGQVACLGASLPATPNTRIIDASGYLVLPGLVDVHVHLRDPGFTHKEDFTSGTRAAAASGITTVVAQPNTNPAITTPEAFAAVREIGERNALVDFGISAAATNDNTEHLQALVQLGALSIDLSLGGSAAALTIRSNAKLLDVLKIVARTGTVATVYTADAEVGTQARERLEAAGRKEAIAYADAFPFETELVGASRLFAAGIATGARIHVRQVSCPQTVELAQRIKPLLQPNQLTIEVTPHHLYLDRSAIELQGVRAVMGPPLRSAQDATALRTALHTGAIDIVCTDHAPHLLAEKDAAHEDVWKCPPGTPGLETMLPALLAAVHRGEMTLAQLVGMASEKPARIFRLYPRKGAIRVGADADLVILDPQAPWTVDPARFHSKARYSPFSGTLRGQVRCTLVRGQVVYDAAHAEEPFRASPGYGRFVSASC